MGLLLRTNAHMGHKYLHKHTMHTLTFGHTRTLAGVCAQVLAQARAQTRATKRQDSRGIRK